MGGKQSCFQTHPIYRIISINSYWFPKDCWPEWHGQASQSILLTPGNYRFYYEDCRSEIPSPENRGKSNAHLRTHLSTGPFFGKLRSSNVAKFSIPAGWWFEPLWKIWKSIGMMTFPIYGKIKNVNQTTNQYKLSRRVRVPPGWYPSNWLVNRRGVAPVSVRGVDPSLCDELL